MAEDFVHIVEPLRAMAVDLRDLIHDPANARTHDRRNLDAIKSSLRAYGQRTPIVVQITGDGRRIIRKGNGTTQAARELAEGGDPRWWMIAAVEVREDNLSATGYAIADNRTAELAAWDGEVLAQLLDEIAQEDAEVLASTGFSDEEIGALLEGMNVPGDEEWASAFDSLPDGDRQPFQSKTFMLHDEQAAVIDLAMDVARGMGAAESDLNTNTNANLLAFVCMEFTRVNS